jgi:hypothetical protein
VIKQLVLDWRRWMGIEPTWNFVEPHAGFEDHTCTFSQIQPPSQLTLLFSLIY